MRILGTNFGRWNNQPDTIIVELTQEELRRIVGGTTCNAITVTQSCAPKQDLEICEKWDLGIRLAAEIGRLQDAQQTLAKCCQVLGEHVVAPAVALMEGYQG